MALSWSKMKEVLEQLHREPSVGQQDVYKTFDKVRQQYWQ
jgi:hypothetical protein